VRRRGFRIFLDNRLRNDSEVINLTRQTPFTSLVRLLLQVQSTPRAMVHLEELHELNKFSFPIGNRNRDHPAYSKLTHRTRLLYALNKLITHLT
jgi:hypothetical protein